MNSVGIATACMNRELNLIKAIPSWLKSGADKISRKSLAHKGWDPLLKSCKQMP